MQDEITKWIIEEEIAEFYQPLNSLTSFVPRCAQNDDSHALEREENLHIELISAQVLNKNHSDVFTSVHSP